MKRSFFVKYYSIAFAILPGKAGGLAVELGFFSVGAASRHGGTAIGSWLEATPTNLNLLADKPPAQAACNAIKFQT
jgi:hypothetical protein